METRQTLLVLGAMLFTLTACDRLLPRGSNSNSQDANTSNAKTTQIKPATTQASLWYKDLTPAQAFKQAVNEDKVVFIECYHSSRNIYEAVELTVLRDEQVCALLAEHTIPIRVNIDKNEWLGQRYQITGTPTLLFLKSDGSEIDRLVGIVGRDSVLKFARGFIDSRDRITMAYEEIAEAHYGLATALVAKDKIPDALAEYGWALDHCLDHPEAFDVVAPRIVRDLNMLTERHIESDKILARRYTAALRRLMDGSGRTVDLKLISITDRWRDELDSTVALYDQIRSQYSDPSLLAEWIDVVFDALLAAKRYEDIAAGMDIEQAVERLFKQAEKERPRRTDYEKAREHLRATIAHNQRLCYAACAYYQVLIALQREAAADALATRLLDVAGGCQTLNGLAWAGYLSGRPTETNLRQAREADGCAHKNSAAIIDTLARILDARGQRDEAVQLLEERINRTNNDSDRNILSTCLTEIKAQP